MYAPLLVAGLAASAAGTGLQIAGNEQDKSALAASQNQQAQQQATYQKQAAAKVAGSLSQSDAPTEQNQINQGAATRYNAFKALQQASQPAIGVPNSPTSGTTTNQVIGATPTQQAQARTATSGGAWSDLQAQAQGQLGGIGDATNQQNIKNSLTAGQLGEISTAAGDQASIYPLEDQTALQSGDSLSSWGQILGALGSVASIGGASGWGAASNAAGAANTAWANSIGATIV